MVQAVYLSRDLGGGLFVCRSESSRYTPQGGLRGRSRHHLCAVEYGIDVANRSGFLEANKVATSTAKGTKACVKGSMRLEADSFHPGAVSQTA